jgi:membrane-associated phospholipid phosphatase
VKKGDLNRREFLAHVRTLSLTTAAMGAIGLPTLLASESAQALQPSLGCEIGPVQGRERVRDAFEVRLEAALYERNLPLPEHPCSGSEQQYPNLTASYTKGLPHNDLGEASLDAYHALLRALSTGNPRDFEAIPLGGSMRLTNPQAALAFELQGPDSHQLAMPPAPAFHSAQQAGEMGELYWQALARDVPFSEYNRHSLTNQAAVDLMRFSDFRGPKANGQVTTDTLFRGDTAGDLIGPYVSQFLWKDIPFGASTLTQQIRVPMPERDYLVKYDECMAVQNGNVASSNILYDPTPRYIRNGRDLAEYVHRDFTYQSYLAAALILLGMRAPFDDGNPYRDSRTQQGFVTFGAAHLLHVVTLVANLVLKASWYQKWMVHRRLRPEEFAVRIHLERTRVARSPAHPDIVAVSPVVNLILEHNRAQAGVGTYLLPQAYPEGCPTHPSYPAGHAAIAGACITVLKAFFSESYVIPDPVIASEDGLALRPYTGPELTVGGELNKLAANMGMGRNFAGIHWRTDDSEGLQLGEGLAIHVLKEMSLTFHEEFAGFTLTKFDGTRITI